MRRGVRTDDSSIADDVRGVWVRSVRSGGVERSIQELETQLKANNARVAVNFKAPAEYFGLIDRQIDEILAQLPEDAMSSARDLLENGCDLTVPAEQPAELDCRIARAVSQGKRPSGGVS